jgi:two-component system sensor histidine kinase/response regulator
MDFNNQDFTILIVDDVDVNVFYISTLLSKEGYRTISATNGREAVDMTLSHNPDLILLDIMMPVMGGLEATKILKSNPVTRHIPIIFLSALNSSEDIVSGFEAGAADYIPKPFKKDELMTRIKHQISLIQAMRIISRQTEELKKTITGRDKLYSVIAHDLRAPLASIKMVMDYLLTRVPRESLDTDAYDMIVMANNLTEDSFSLLDNLLKWTTSQTGTLNTVLQKDVDMMNLIKSVVDSLESVARLKNINIEIIGETSCEATVDIDMIKSVIRNLLSNSIKFSYENEKIELCIKEEPEKLIIEIRDFGIGMNEEEQNKLFDNEQHFSSFGTGNESGSGLGLLLCREFVHRNGGELWFRSEKGDGSTFCFYIPLPQ